MILTVDSILNNKQYTVFDLGGGYYRTNNKQFITINPIDDNV